jgi:hypothetical protein
MIRKNGMTKNGWSFQKFPEQPYVERYGLHIVEVKPVLTAQPVAPEGRFAGKPASRP